MRNYGIPLFFRKWRYMVAAILNLKKCTRGIFGASLEFIWGDVHVSFLKKSAFCNFIPGSTLMLLHYMAEACFEYMYTRLSPSGQITNAVRSSLRSIFFGPNLFPVKAISKAITNAVRPPFRTTVKFFWQNGMFTLVIAVK